VLCGSPYSKKSSISHLPFFWGVKLSEELLALLKRTQTFGIPKYKEPSSEPSPALLALLGRMAAREWRDDQLILTIEYLKQSANEIKFIQHLRTCRECQMEASLSVERYYGRGLPWFLDLINDVVECYADYNNDEDAKELSQWDHRFDDCPRVGNYRIGSYWDRTIDSKETLQFINDRCNWAEKTIRQQIMMAVDYYKLLKEWDLTGEYPLEPALPFSY